MIKSRHIIRLVTIQAALCLLFSISSFADGYSFQEDGDQHDQRFSGTNKVYTDGIYVGEMGVIDAYMDNGFNTYTGTNIIDATAYPGAGQDSDSTYNGTLDVTANDIVSSKTTIDDATVNASTSVTVNDVLAENNLNAGVQFNNSNFNNDVTLSGSGAVNLEGSTVNNLVLGNIPQMQSLLDLIFIFENEIAKIHTSSSNTVTLRNSYTGNNVTLNLNSLWLPQVTYNSSTKQFSFGEYQNPSWMYANFAGRISLNLRQIALNFANIFNGISDISYSIFNTWWDAYRPNKLLTDPNYWIAYNTDTGEYDTVNLATVFGYMTWYLGQLYNDSSNVTETMHQMTEDIGTAASTFQDLNQKEQTAIDQISQGFNSFLPDVNTFSSFRAITWCSNYLQQIYLSLGSYGTVIFIALLFGVCLQFIGYFRYK